jgi:hypothetical protein
MLINPIWTDHIEAPVLQRHGVVADAALQMRMPCLGQVVEERRQLCRLLEDCFGGWSAV